MELSGKLSINVIFFFAPAVQNLHTKKSVLTARGNEKK